MQEQLNVVAAVIQREEREYLMAQKSGQSSQPYAWEFPGGKVEAGESEPVALQREILEELSVEIKVLKKVGESHGVVAGREIYLSAYLCRLVSTDIQLTEHLQFKWLNLSALTDVQCGALDEEIIHQLRINIKRTP